MDLKRLYSKKLRRTGCFNLAVLTRVALRRHGKEPSYGPAKTTRPNFRQADRALVVIGKRSGPAFKPLVQGADKDNESPIPPSYAWAYSSTGPLVRMNPYEKEGRFHGPPWEYPIRDMSA